MKILLAVDGSSQSQSAADLLRETAGGHGHRVTVFNVTPPVLRSPEKGLTSITEALKESALAMTASYEKGLRQGKSFRTETLVAESQDVAGAVLDRAKKDRADLIVLGARGLSPFKAFFLGSVSQKVLGHASTPVLIVRGGPTAGPLKVLAAVDGSPSGRRALRFLVRLGLPRGARVTLLHAVTDPLAGWVPGPYGMTIDSSISVASEAKAMESLRRKGRRILAAARKTFGGRTEAVLEEGFPGDAIIGTARALSADLIVVGRRGLTGLDRFLLGSVSQKAAAYAGCSVLVVR